LFAPFHVIASHVNPHTDGDNYAIIQTHKGKLWQFLIPDVVVGQNLFLHPERDGAVIKLPDHVKVKSWVKFGQPQIGMEIGLAGYPEAKLTVDNGKPNYSAVMFKVERGFIRSRHRRDLPARHPSDHPLTNIEVLELNFLTSHGYCGGPVFDIESGDVFGHLMRSEITMSMGDGATSGQPIFSSFAVVSS
jgi:hypothetical protein